MLSSQQQGNKWKQLEALYKQEGIPSLATCHMVNSVTLGTAEVSLGGLQGCERADIPCDGKLRGAHCQREHSSQNARGYVLAQQTHSRHALPGVSEERAWVCKVEVQGRVWMRFVSLKKSTSVHVIDKCIRETNTAGLHSMPFSISTFLVPFGWMHHSMALTHEMAVE